MAEYMSANTREVMWYFGYDETDEVAFKADWGGLTATEKIDLRQEVGARLEKVGLPMIDSSY